MIKKTKVSESAETSAVRREQIVRELRRNGAVEVDALAARHSTSSSTIRRDLAELERAGLLHRTHGGAVLIEQFLYEPFRHVSSFQEQEQERAKEKRLIGQAAAELVADGETVAIGAGTTTTQVARNLRHRKGIMVVTNAVNIAMELSHSREIKVVLTGGELSGDWFALVGPAAIGAVREIFVDKAFIGVDGLHAVHGLTTNYPDQAAIHRAILEQARQRIVVADRSKIGVIGTALIVPAGKIEILVSDKGLSESQANPFEKLGIRIKKA